MKKENGFILLNHLISNWHKKIKDGTVVPNDLCGPFYNGYWLKNVEEKDWFLKISKKSGFSKALYCELLAEELARNVVIPTVHSEIVKCGPHTYGLISESYLVPGYDVISGYDILLQYCEKIKLKKPHNIASLEFIWEALEEYFRNYPNKRNIVMGLMKDLTERYVFHFILMDRDFHLKNFEILINDKHAALSPLYDMDLCFDENFLTEYNSLTATYEENPIYTDFANYYEMSSSYFKNELERQLSIFTPTFLLKSMETVENAHQIVIPKEEKIQILERYEKHYEKLKQMINQKRGRK